MRFYIVDDDEAIRSMLTDIIEDYDLGCVAGEAKNGAMISQELLTLKKVDILIIDMLMPKRDGIQTVNSIKDTFTGKIIMLSQVENKELVGKAYSLGVHYYITKPINRNEVVSIIKTASDHIRLKTLVNNIESSLHIALRPGERRPVKAPNAQNGGKNAPIATVKMIMSEMGISAEKGSKDLLAILEFLLSYESGHREKHDFPSLKVLFNGVAEKKLPDGNETELQKECKALEQRLRRTIFQALVNLASIGIVDYANPKFEDYAAKFFDFAEVRKVMLVLESNEKPLMSQAHINLKKFINVLFIEANKEPALK